ncbi:MAG: hypothetical protein FWE69_08560 [Clostridiales bacterium]|nr:hypothetical protein [Clostridiales bacterium]
MTKKRIKLIVSIVLTMILCLCAALPVAADPLTDEPILGTEQTPALASITKILEMGEGVPTPEITFSFAFTAVSVDGVTSGADYDAMPPITRTVSFLAADPDNTSGGIKTVRLETGSLFAGVNWPHAGVYIYTVEETKSVTPTLSAQESILYSPAKYKVTAWVANGANGLYVAAIASEIVVTDGENGTEVGEKVDARPGGDPSVSGDYSQMTFTNNYKRVNSAGDPDDYTLAISKAVTTDALADYDFANRQMYFDFSVTVTKSGSNADAAQKYKAYILDESNAVVTGTANVSSSYIKTDSVTDEDYIEFTTGDPLTVHLKHGQWLSFVDLESGATYTVTETGTTDFTPSVSLVVNGAQPVVTNGTLHTSLTVPATLIGVGDNRADYTNTYKTITPTGISVDDLPYIVLVALIALTLVGFAVIRARKNAKHRA